MSWFKYFLTGLIFMMIILLIYFGTLSHRANIVSTQDIGFLTESINAGGAREGELHLSPEVIEAELMLQIADSKKGRNEGSLKVNFAYLDDEGNPTENEDNIHSVQYEVIQLTLDGLERSISVERIELDDFRN